MGMFWRWLQFEKLMLLVVLWLYTALSSILLVYFEANVVIVTLVLSVIPVVVLWRLEHLHSRLVPIVLLLAFGGAAIFEASAYINGIWYALSPSEYRLFDLLPVEAFLAAFTHLLYFVVVYEYFIDDGTSGELRPQSLAWLTAGVSGCLALGLGYLYLFSGAIFSYSFAWLLLIGTVGILALTAFLMKSWWRLLGKTALFATLVYPITLIYEYVALSNNLRFFANTNDYLWYFEVLGQPLPLEELLFMWLVPFWFASIYELYIDDGE